MRLDIRCWLAIHLGLPWHDSEYVIEYDKSVPGGVDGDYLYHQIAPYYCRCRRLGCPAQHYLPW